MDWEYAASHELEFWGDPKTHVRVTVQASPLLKRALILEYVGGAE